jgi:RimJ/RimL family protein N-acetyltransferase
MTTFAIQRLGARSSDALVAHFLALTPADRRLRFGASLASERIAAYVDEIDFTRDAVFAAHDDRLAPIGVAHVAFTDEQAELGLSVSAGHRGCGVGSALFERATTHARNRLVPRLFMHCLAENAPVMRIARRFGMIVVTESGDAEAHLALSPASLSSIGSEFVADRLALCDFTHKGRAAAWRSIESAPGGEGGGSRIGFSRRSSKSAREPGLT